MSSSSIPPSGFIMPREYIGTREDVDVQSRGSEVGQETGMRARAASALRGPGALRPGNQIDAERVKHLDDGAELRLRFSTQRPV